MHFPSGQREGRSPFSSAVEKAASLVAQLEIVSRTGRKRKREWSGETITLSDACKCVEPGGGVGVGRSGEDASAREERNEWPHASSGTAGK